MKSNEHLGKKRDLCDVFFVLSSGPHHDEEVDCPEGEEEDVDGVHVLELETHGREVQSGGHGGETAGERGQVHAHALRHVLVRQTAHLAEMKQQTVDM